VTLRIFDPIWHISGSVPVAADLSNDAVFDRLDPLFLEEGTTHERGCDTLTFTKIDPAAQDKMSVFDHGVLKLERGPGGSELHYRMASKILLFVFLAPLLFLAFAQINIVAGNYQAASKETAEKKKPEKKDLALPQHPIDKMLGSPAPEKPKKKKDKKATPTTGYVFAGIFAVLYVVGRILEGKLVRSLFLRSLRDPALGPPPLSNHWLARFYRALSGQNGRQNNVSLEARMHG